MFGLMNIHASASTEDRKAFHMHYCGNCKTMGRQYSQTIRLSNNYDIAFMGELLSALAPQRDWEAPFRSYHCFQLPREEQIPPHLRYTAAVNVLLTELKIADNYADHPRKAWLWKLARRFFLKDFGAARERAETLGLPVDQIWTHFADQLQREKQGAPEAMDAPARMAYFAAPTAAMTSLVFGYSAYVIGRPGLQQGLSRLGTAFGELVYLLDAFEDFAQDARSGQFNALAAAFNTDCMSPLLTEQMLRYFHERKDQFKVLLSDLPVPGEVVNALHRRLCDNLNARIWKGCSPKEIATSSVGALNWSEKWRLAIKQNKQLLTATPGRSGFFGRLGVHTTFILRVALFVILPSSAWAQSSGEGNHCGSIILCLCIASLCGGGQEYVVEKDCCGNTVVREKTCC